MRSRLDAVLNTAGKLATGDAL